MCEIDWPTLLAFVVTVLTVIATTVITIKHQKKALETQISIAKESADRDKEKSRAEFISASRQAWINSLRDEVSSFLSDTTSIWDLFQQKSGRAEILAALGDPKYAMSELASWSIAYGSSITNAERSRAKIFLLLNPNEQPSIELMAAIDSALKAAKDKVNPSILNSKVVAALHPILKNEWTRVKKVDGE